MAFLLCDTVSVLFPQKFPQAASGLHKLFATLVLLYSKHSDGLLVAGKPDGVQRICPLDSMASRIRSSALIW